MRFTTRRLMAAVALAAVLCAGGFWVHDLIGWSRTYRVIADRQEKVRFRLERSARVVRNPASRQAIKAQAAWYATRRDAYARAAKTPWVTVPADDGPDFGAALARARAR